MRAWSKSKLNCNEGKYGQDDGCAVAEVDLRQLRGDVMDMIVQFLRWDLQQLRGDVIGLFCRYCMWSL